MRHLVVAAFRSFGLPGAAETSGCEGARAAPGAGLEACTGGVGGAATARFDAGAVPPDSVRRGSSGIGGSDGAASISGCVSGAPSKAAPADEAEEFERDTSMG